MPYHKIAIIILNWNGLENTRECLDSLKKINYPDFEIILIDNASRNNEGDILKKEYGDFTPRLLQTDSAFSHKVQSVKGAGFITLIQNQKNLGFAEGNNIGIEKALENPEIKYVLCLNNDTTVEPDFIEKALEKISDSKIGMTAPKIMNYYKKDKIDSFGIQFTKSGLSFNIKILNHKNCHSGRMGEKSRAKIDEYWILKQIQDDKKENYLFFNSRLFCPCGAAAFYSRQLLEKLKEQDGYYFDPDFFAYAEDLDLGFRARLLGFECSFAEKSLVYHKGSASTKTMSDLSVYHTYRNIIRVLMKNLPAPLFWRYLPKIIIGQSAIIFLWILRGKPFLIFKAYFHALFGLPKMLKKRKIIQKNKKISNRDLDKLFTPQIFVKEYLKNIKKLKKI